MMTYVFITKDDVVTIRSTDIQLSAITMRSNITLYISYSTVLTEAEFNSWVYTH